MLRFNDILDRVASYNPNADMDLLRKAYVFSAKVHLGQIRLSGEPYLIHPLEVAGILTQMKLDGASVATGLLHDTVEDTLTSVKEIRENFGDEIAQLVDGLTKISKIPLRVHRGGTGGEFPEDDPRHGQGYPGHPDQAGRPPP